MSCLKEKAMVGRIGGTLIGALIAGPSDWATPALGGAIGFGSGFVHGLFTCPPNNDPNPYPPGPSPPGDWPPPGNNPDNPNDPWGGDPHGPHPPLGDDDPSSPLILDLDGDGVEADAIAFFDHEGEGFAELSAWAGGDDGTLVWDKNNDGVINDGSELFGNNTVLTNGNKAEHGFAALADLDSNNDGVINSSDTAWANLQVMRWTDDNGNGIKDDGEESLVTLDSLDIESLNTGFTNSNHVDSSGNEHRQEGGYTQTVINDDGTTETITRKMTDVWFVTNDAYTQYDDSDIPTHSTAIEALPDIKGYGRTYNLRDAMALDDATDANGNSRLSAPYYSNNRTETRSLREWWRHLRRQTPMVLLT